MTERQPTDAEKAFMDRLTATSREIYAYSTRIEAINGSPLATSLMIYNRLWSNYRGYIVLWKAGHLLEANIILRAAVESAICLCANQVLREGFYPLLLGDLAASVKKMIKLWRDMDAYDLVRGYEETLRSLPPATPAKPSSFNWQELAEAGGIRRLYEDHRMLSATSSHVTALSIMRGVASAKEESVLQEELLQIDGAMGPMKACAAQLIGSKMHALLLENADILRDVAEHEAELNKLSERWVDPG